MFITSELSFYLFAVNLFSVPGDNWSAFCHYSFDSRILGKQCHTVPNLLCRASFYSEKCFWDLSMVVRASAVCSFLLLNCIPLYGYITTGSRLLWIKMLWISTYKSLCRHKFLFFLRHTQGKCLFYFLRNYLTLSMLRFHQWFKRVPVAPYPNQQRTLLIFSTLAVLIPKNRYFVVALICIFLIINDLEHILVCLFSNCISFLGKCLPISLSIFHLSCSYFVIEIEVFFIHSGCKSFIRYMF